MAKQNEGWDSELFLEPPTEGDLCGICCEVLRDAVETGCGHAFCEKCIKGWLSQRQVCPQDQTALTWADCRPMVRDRRRILDMKVKCPYCETKMELRDLHEHKRSKCQQKPDDYEPTPDPEQVQDHERKEPEAGEEEFIIEPVDDGQDQKALEDKKIEEARKAREAKDAEDRDRLFALQMQISEQDRARNLSVQPQNRKISQSPQHRVSQSPQRVQPQVQLVQPQGEAHVEVFEVSPGGGAGGAPLVEYYQADAYGADGYEGQEGQPVGKGKNPIRQIPAKRGGCCGCSDRCWCCLCCVFWVLLLVLGLSIWYFGVAGTASKVGL